VEAFPIPATNDDDSAMKPFVDSMMSAMSCGKDRDKLSAIGAATHDQTGLIARAMTSWGSAALAVQTRFFKTKISLRILMSSPLLCAVYKITMPETDIKAKFGAASGPRQVDLLIGFDPSRPLHGPVAEWRRDGRGTAHQSWFDSRLAHVWHFGEGWLT
jgi:hypothetical protein